MRIVRPQTVRIERIVEDVGTLVRANRSQYLDHLTAAVGVSHGTCYKILTDELNMCPVTQHSVPHIPTQDQRHDRMTICGDLISRADVNLRFANGSQLETKHDVCYTIRN